MKRSILLLLLVLAAVGGYFYYQSLKAGPKYALVQVANAARTHDMATFERYVDVNSVTGSLVDQVANQGPELGSMNPGGLAFKSALRMLKPQLSQMVRKEVQQLVETGSLQGAADASVSKGIMNISLAGLAGKVASPDSKFKDVKYVKEEGKQALVSIEFTQPKYDTTMVVELKMLNRGDHWQVTEITNTGDLLKQVARLEKQRMLK
ncbi:DUF2939 domain-containing protein [Hymenobacter volaticus]|uniref:DUF2939 domain-containing protein n=1 Tax=Hymenobacter volaticus TaxID=2932254 RepID=A0ABY4G6B1_9BACT|nr:DUF2939 domain-containing protein [Hymenobacter volaticus]UOQ66307.1 DUF2939 domain-containing protein [Hymenobacter volaticus]